MPDDIEPTHLLLYPGDRLTLCGLKTRNTKRVLSRFATAHTDGHPETFVACEDCTSVARENGIALG